MVDGQARAPGDWGKRGLCKVAGLAVCGPGHVLTSCALNPCVSERINDILFCPSVRSIFGLLNFGDFVSGGLVSPQVGF
jgi:hypothetical protein